MKNSLHIISAALVVLFGSLASFNWAGFVSPTTAAEIVTGLGAAKLLLSFVSPSVAAPAAPLAGTSAG